MVVGVVTRQRYWSVCVVCSVCLLMFSRPALQTFNSKDHEQKNEQSAETEAKDNSLYLYCTGASWHVSMSHDVAWCHIMNIAGGSTLLHRSLDSTLHTTVSRVVHCWAQYSLVILARRWWCFNIIEEPGLRSDRSWQDHNTGRDLNRNQQVTLTPHQQILI